VQIIAHQNTCATVPQKTVPRMKARLEPMMKQLDEMRTKRASLPEGDKEGASLDRRIAGTELYLQDAKEFKWEMPTTCLDLKMGQAKVITDGARRIEIRYFGRAHSTGDLVVFLPKEKVLAMADLWAENTGDMLIDSGLDGRDGSVLEGPLTQKAIRKLDFDVALPGHSAVMRGKAGLDAAIGYGEKFVARIKESADNGDNVEEALQKMPPPANASAFTTARWRRVIIRGFEEIELRRQLRMKLPG
jgi:glyoxylase-like metal-dependent hydrolase (beta-lactamase superfamily II)